MLDSRVTKCNRLLRRIQAGSDKALEELYAEFGPLFLNMAKKYLYNKDYAEDLVSEVFLDLIHTSAKSFDDNKNGLNWIYTIIRRKAFRFNEQTSHIQSIDEENPPRLEDCIMERYSQEARVIDNLMLQQALASLSNEENLILYYKYWEGQTIRQIAKRLDIPRSTIQYRIDAILAKLKAFCDEGERV